MLFLAAKHILSRKKQSLVTLAGIIVGTTAFIVISSFFAGFRSYLTDSLVSGDAQIKIQARERTIDRNEVEPILFPGVEHVVWSKLPSGRRASQTIENSRGWLDRLSVDPAVRAATAVYTTTALVAVDQTPYSLSIIGTRPEDLVRVTNIASKVTSGSFVDLGKGTGGIVIGSELAVRLGRQVGDSVVLTTTLKKQQPFKIVGIFSSGNKAADLASAYTTLADAQRLGGALGRVSQISVKVADFQQAGALAASWRRASTDKIESWDEANASFLSIFHTQDIMRFMATGIIMLVAAFGIYNILNMVVTQKRRDIAILRSMGYESRDVIELFLLQGIFLGVAGGLIGCCLAFAISAGIGEVGAGPPGQNSGSFTLQFELGTYLTAMLIANAAAMAASYLPARAASRLTPIEIIRTGAD